MSDYSIRGGNYKAEIKKNITNFDVASSFKVAQSQYIEVVDYLAALAVGTILTELDAPKFQRICSRAAENWLAFLTTAKQLGKAVPTGKNLGLHCAVAAGNFDMAAQIAELTSSEKTRWEYEDEFYSSRLFCLYFLHRHDLESVKDEILDLCAKMEEYLEMETDPVCFYRSLFGEPYEKTASFVSWHNQKDFQYSEKMENSRHTYTSRVIESLWLEGLSISLVEERAGFSLPRHFKMIPSLLLTNNRVPLCGDLILGTTKTMPSEL